MALTSIGPALRRARKESFAVPLFDTADMQSTEGMLRAFSEKEAPGIIGLYAGMLDHPNARALAAYIRIRAEEAPFPVSLMLDHGGSPDQCRTALDYGFTDVMYDGSRLSLEENIARTRAVVEFAHERGACVEAELGQVGSGSDYQSFGARRKGFTDPDTVERFVAETGVDFLAIAVGTAHGLYDGDPQVDIELLRNIASRVDIPLALHGGTGCAEEQFRAAIASGISKVNVATDLFMAAGERMAGVAAQKSYFEFSRLAADSFCERSGYYLDLLGATGKGGPR
ncbi:MAG: class II fructose-bisphosphate aldolase [Armatimonadetes bacterium]|nr:class II fructose-bisphosphate aldolase [Armatimonadota bacterium]